MTSVFASWHNPASEQTQNWFIGSVLLMITLLRSAAVIITPLELGVDEAQYWLWSQTPDFGYFTKPPLIAWLIGVSHWLLGHHTWAVRLPACWIHFGTSLLLWQAALWLYGQRAGRLTAMIWITLPAIGLGSFVISTDTPLLAFWSAGLLAICGIVSGRLTATTGMVLAGSAFGVAVLAKYAGIYALASLFLIILHGYAGHQQLFSWRHFLLAIIAFGLFASPNIIWNFTNDFVSFRHLGDNANIQQHSASFDGVWQFIGSQFVVAGPLTFVVMLIGATSSFRNKQTLWLFWMWAPVFALMAVQSYLSEANANWAMTAFPALTLLAAGWLSNQKRYFRIATVGINISLSLFILIVTIAGSMGPLTPKSDPLRRLRGWQQLSEDLRPVIAAHGASAIIADLRPTASLLSWHFYATDLRILVHDKDGVPSNHFEANHKWSPQPGRRLIALTGEATPPTLPGVNWVRPFTTTSIKISQNKTRQFTVYRGIE